MTNSPFTPGIVPARLDGRVLQENFADLHAPLDAHEALVAADRCYFCHDAPCITACPTTIDDHIGPDQKPVPQGSAFVQRPSMRPAKAPAKT